MTAHRYLFIFFLLSSFFAKAQYITVDETFTAQQLVENILINNPCANVSNVSVNGWPMASNNSYGHFLGGSSTFPFTEGIVLSTGKAISAVGPNNTLLSEGPTSWGGDSDLEYALGVSNSINATVLEFDFLPQASKVSFDYIFASEQYLTNPSANQCNYTDGFVFLLKEAGTPTDYQNLAIIPGTTTPVKVNTVRGPGTVCPAANEAYFAGFNGGGSPTNFNGQTVVMTAVANVTPGVLYHMKLVVADQGNNLYDSAIFLGAGSFKIQKDLGPYRLISNNNPICDGETLTVDATETGSNTYQWYKDNVALPGETNPMYTIGSAGTYSVQITNTVSGCNATGTIKVEYAPAINPVNSTLLQCDTDNDGIAVFDLTRLNATILGGNTTLTGPSYYENTTDPNPIQTPQNYTSAPKTIYAKVENQYGCFAFATVTLDFSNATPASPSQVPVCDTDDDGIATFNTDDITPFVLQGLPAGLTVMYYKDQPDAAAETNPLPAIYTNTTPFNQTIWARITNGPDCYGLVSVPLVVHVFHPFNGATEQVTLCENTTITLSVPTGFAQYLWSNGSTSNSIAVQQPATYSVTVTDANGCTDNKTFVVEGSGPATITAVEIEDFKGDANTVTVTVSGSGDYLFSLDGENYQQSNVFTDVISGAYTLYVKDSNRCGIVTQDLFVIDYPKFFTPNNDGYNDIWQIQFLRLHPKATVRIFDRYGKLLYAFQGSGSGWDGKLNAQPLPANDYWFVVAMEDGRIIRGHFALKR